VQPPGSRRAGLTPSQPPRLNPGCRCPGWQPSDLGSEDRGSPAGAKSRIVDHLRTLPCQTRRRSTRETSSRCRSRDRSHGRDPLDDVVSRYAGSGGPRPSRNRTNLPPGRLPKSRWPAPNRTLCLNRNPWLSRSCSCFSQCQPPVERARNAVSRALTALQSSGVVPWIEVPHELSP
jgi:hypothetical protein